MTTERDLELAVENHLRWGAMSARRGRAVNRIAPLTPPQVVPAEEMFMPIPPPTAELEEPPEAPEVHDPL